MMKIKNIFALVTFAILGLMLLQNCAPDLSDSGQSCPCKDGWKCCQGETGEDLCVPRDEACPCAGANGEWIAGEMVVTPDQMQTSVQLNGEIQVWVFEALCEERPPVEKVDIVVRSSRNQGDDQLDLLEQPISPTDADGRVVAFIGSSTPGDSVLTVYMGGSELCKIWRDAECVEPLKATVTFNP